MSPVVPAPGNRSAAARQRIIEAALNHVTLVLLVLVLMTFGMLSPRFLTGANLTNLLVQASSTAIVGIGMTFVLLTAGVDLSVGAIMFVAAAVAGKLLLAGMSLPVALAAIVLIGVVYGMVNAFLITRLGMLAFIATLGTLYLGRGLGLWITQTRAMNLPDGFLALGASRWLGVPLPLWVFGAVLVSAHVTLTRTPYGRQLYAVGHQAAAARKAGLNTRRLRASVYVISGLCAALGGILSLAQLGAVSPSFGTYREFGAIAAAVLGGTSLFGGRGAVFPGTVLGAVLIQSIENGLVILNADPYLYPLVSSAIIFVAVLADATRNRWLERLGRRRIYAVPG
ncbi:MAG: ABC transporter permease [Verrucomicrobiae bacterium]|nr:ABC transporter permease [Verrucomicrobiae bacterium]